MIDKLLLLQKELIKLKGSDRVIITSPRRAGKTTLLRNIIASYLDYWKSYNILFIAPHKKFNILELEPITTIQEFNNKRREIYPLITVIEEAAYCNNELLEYIDKYQDSPKVFVTTPRAVGYLWNDEIYDWECTNYVKRLIDQDKARVFSYHFKDFDKALQTKMKQERRRCTKIQWRCDYNGEWVE